MKSANLPNISYVQRKPKPLGIEFKTVCEAMMGVMIYMEIQRGKDAMRLMPYFADVGATTACTLQMVDGTNHCGHMSDDDEMSDLTFIRQDEATGIIEEK